MQRNAPSRLRPKFHARLVRNLESGRANVFQNRFGELVNFDSAPTGLQVDIQRTVESHLILGYHAASQPKLERAIRTDRFDILLTVANQQELSPELRQRPSHEIAFNFQGLMTTDDYAELLVGMT